MLKQHSSYFSVAQRVLDLLVVALSWVAAFYVRFFLISGAQKGMFFLYCQLSVLLMAISAYWFHQAGIYRSQRFNSRGSEIISLTKANMMSFLTLVVALYFIKLDPISRGQLLIYACLSTASLIATHFLIRSFLRSLRRRGKNLRHVLLVGNARHLADYVQGVRIYEDCGINIIGWLQSGGLAEASAVRDLGEGDNWDEFKADSVVVGFRASDSQKLEDFLRLNHNSLADIKVIPDLTYSYLGHQIEDFAGIPVLSINAPHLSFIEVFTKRALDFALTLVGLILISPLLALIAIGVRLSSPGPILYGQKRMGLDGQHFTMWKFRSMRLATPGDDTKEWSNKDNPRKTKFGAFLRSTSLDELPQLFNVLFGQMSLVGPRPEQPYFVEKFRNSIPAYMLRHKMKAGITGWAQVNGWRGDTSLEKRIECDIFYIKNWSFWFDLKILFLTFFKGFKNKNAY